MRAAIRPGELPPFHGLDEYAFQELCRDLLDHEQEVATCEVYGQRGVPQDGIDLLAHRVGGDSVEVGQCKRYRDFPPAMIEAASDEFFAHWGRWATEDVRRFILFVTSDMQPRQRQDKILAQKRRFADRGIVYEVWSPATIRNKLRPYPPIVTTYFPNAEYWVRDICGVVPPPAEASATSSSGVVPATDIGQLERLIALVSGQVAGRLDDIRAAWREGRRGEARDGLRRLRDDAGLWATLTLEVKARALRLEASLELDASGDTARATRLADEAAVLDSSDGDARLRALIAHRGGDTDTALRLLDGKDDADSANLRHGLLVEAGRADECRATLTRGDATDQSDAEALRLRAFVHLADKDIDLARLAIARALELEPRWAAVRYTAATVDYWGALSPAALPGRIVAWPEPADWAFVKRDDESMARLRGAADTFAALIREADGEERAVAQAWRLACLANDPGRAEEASAYCREMLAADPADYRAIAWAAARAYDTDRKASATALRRRIFRGKASVPHILALAISYLEQRKAPEAVALLEDTRPVFEVLGEDALSLWVSWYVQASLADGDVDRAARALEEAPRPGDLRHVRAFVLEARARETAEWSPLVRHLEASYEETGDAAFLFEGCAAMDRLGDWAYVADRADLLVSRCATEAALRLAATAADHAGRDDLCLRLLDGHLDLFAGRRPPADLRRLRVAALRAQGVLVEAAAAAETLAHEEPTTSNILSLMQIYADQGDLASLALVARRLDGRADLPPTQALRVVSLIVQDATELAATLWRQVVGREHLSDEDVTTALDLGLRLGLDAEAAPLFERARLLAERGQAGTRAMTVDELIPFIRQQREREAELDDLYRRGAAPIQVLAASLNLPLAELYHRRLLDNEAAPDPVGQFALFARHGGRAPVPDVADAPRWRLHLDVTALLLAAHLDALPAVERAYRPLHIPADLVPALLEMRARAAPHQPMRERTYRQIVALVEGGAIGVVDDAAPSPEDADLVADLGAPWVALYRRARADGGYILDYLPLQRMDRRGPPAALPQGDARRVVNSRALVEALWEHGALTDRARDEALRGLGVEGQALAAVARPEAGAPLYCAGNTAETLADAELLRVVCDHVSVRIGADELARARAAIVGIERARALADWLGGLVDRVRRGIADGTYAVMPRSGVAGDDADDAGGDAPAVRCIGTLLGFQPRPGDAVWMDDRFLNGYVRQERGAPIVGICEVLKGVRGAGELTTDAYYEKVGRLRAANVRYIPIEADEILHHLRRARVVDGALVEHPGLATLRRYLAACLAHARDLQPPAPAGRAPELAGEDAFLDSSAGAIAAALAYLWAMDDDDIAGRARAEWVLDALYLDGPSWRRVATPSRPGRGDIYDGAGGLVTLLAYALPIDTQAHPEAATARRRYRDWLYGRLLGPRCEAEPPLVVAMADMVRTILLLIREDGLRDTPVDVVVATLQTLHEELPAPIRGELERDVALMARLGYEVRPRVAVGGLAFDPDAFWAAARDALDGRDATLVPDDATEPVTFTKVDDRPGHDAIYLAEPGTGRRIDVATDDLGLLRASVAGREEFLRRHREWFDGPDAVVDRAIAEIATTEDPQGRMDKVAEWRRSSAAVYNARLPSLLARRGAAPLRDTDLLPPSVDGLLRHLRLDANAGEGAAFGRALDEAALTLLREEGIDAALDRLAGLPVSLPPSIVGALGSLSAKARRALVGRLLRARGSPLSRIHLAGVLVRLEGDTPAYRRRAARLVARLAGERGRAEVAAHLSVLRWVGDHLARRPDVRGLAPHIRLAIVWAHAHRLVVAYAAAGASPRWVAATFGRPTRETVRALFDRERDYRLDCAHPERVGLERLLVAGVADAQGDGTTGLVAVALAALSGGRPPAGTGGTIVSHPSLVVDTSRSRDGLDSFLGGDLVDRLALRSGDGPVTVAALRALVGQQVDRLAEASDDTDAWSVLHMVLGDLPPYGEVADAFECILRGTDIAHLLRARAPAGLMALLVAALQVANYGGAPLRDHLKDQAVQIAEYLAEREVSARSGTVAGDDVARERQAIDPILLSLARNLCAVGGDAGEELSAFADLVARLIGACAALIPLYRPVVRNIWESLPLSDAQHVAPLLVRMRAAEDVS